MAKANSTQQAPARTVAFTVGNEVYLHNPAASAWDRRNQLDARLAQLSAMLLAAHGESGVAFKNMNDNDYDSYFWACRSLAEECRELIRRGCDGSHE